MENVWNRLFQNDLALYCFTGHELSPILTDQSSPIAEFMIFGVLEMSSTLRNPCCWLWLFRMTSKAMIAPFFVLEISPHQILEILKLGSIPSRPWNGDFVFSTQLTELERLISIFISSKGIPPSQPWTWNLFSEPWQNRVWGLMQSVGFSLRKLIKLLLITDPSNSHEWIRILTLQSRWTQKFIILWLADAGVGIGILG